MASVIRLSLLAPLAIGACLAMLPGFAQAQYKWIGADGRVNYSDLPPPPEHRRVLRTPGGAVHADAASGGDLRLPYALRSAVLRYPVVLYTGDDCPPCEQGRSLLSKRGVPFTEKRIQTGADARAFEALGFGESGLPALSVGASKMVGFESTRWDQALDAAGYPKSSMLPADHLARTVAPMHEEARTASDSAAAGARDGTSAGTAADQHRIDAGGLLLPAAQDIDPQRFRF